MSLGLVLIRGGNVDEQRLREKPLLCRCNYFAFTGTQFIRLRLDLIDVHNISLAVRAEQLRANNHSLNWSLDTIFREICEKGLSDRPNPFDKHRSNSARK
jgi:hypothetical protein